MIPFKRPVCPSSHPGSIGHRVRRLYVCHPDLPKQYLVFLVDWVVAARPAEDSAGGCRPAVCMPLLHALMHAPQGAVTLSLSL